MEVLEKGNAWSEKMRCTGEGNGGYGCNAVLMVRESDLFITISYPREGETRYISFICPECNVRTDVLDDDIPPKVLSRLKPRRQQILE